MKHILRNLLIASMILAGTTTAFASTIPNTPTLYESYLANSQGISDVTLTVASATLNDGSALSGYVCLTIDANTPSLEYECGTMSGTSVTGLSRGIDFSSGTTTSTALQFAHRRGADVKITDYPTLTILSRIFQNIDTIALPISYGPSVATSTIALNRQNLVDWGLLQDTSFQGSGAIAATTNAKGYVQLATTLQTASSTSVGSSGAFLVIPSSNATSTYNASTAPLRVVVTQNSGVIDPNFIGQVATSSTIGTTTLLVQDTGKRSQVFTSVGTTTFSVPNSIKTVTVEVQGAGATGGACNAAPGAGGGGGGGGWSIENIDVSATTTVQVFVGASDQWSTFGTNGFYLYATPGAVGTLGAASTATPGGIGGVGVGGDLNGYGDSGGSAVLDAATTAITTSGKGGGSRYGGGAISQTGGVIGITGNVYGGGGSGASCANSTSRAGGAGAQGMVRVSW